MRKMIVSAVSAVVFLAFSPLTIRADGPHVIEVAPSVAVLPFNPIGDPRTNGWVGAGIQQSLLTEVNRPGAVFTTVSVSSVPSTQPSAITPDPIADAASAGASIAVFGNYQIVGDDIRCTGQVVEISTGRVISGLKTTGPIHDLFKLEDDLGKQLLAALPQAPQPVASTAVSIPNQQGSPAVIDYGSAPVAQVYNYSYPAPVSYCLPYPYYTSYRYASYCPPINSGFVFYGNFNRGGFNNSRFGGSRGFGGGSISHPVGFGGGFHITGGFGGRR